MLPLTCGILVLMLSAFTAESMMYEYSRSSDLGPRYWATIDQDADGNPDSPWCAGMAQSPIDVVSEESAYDPMMPPLHMEMMMQQNPATLHHEASETIVVQLTSKNYVTGGGLAEGQMYEEQLLEFHTPSEHRINGGSFPLEMFVVYANKNPDIASDPEHPLHFAAISIVFKEGMESEFLKPIIKGLPKVYGVESMFELTELLDFSEILQDGAFYAYKGSAPSPPCLESVTHHVMAEPREASWEQILAFTNATAGTYNHRPTQPTNGRVVRTNVFKEPCSLTDGGMVPGGESGGEGEEAKDKVPSTVINLNFNDMFSGLDLP